MFSSLLYYNYELINYGDERCSLKLHKPILFKTFRYYIQGWLTFNSE
ncbi:MAG: hypothetical protein ACJAXB_002512 [Candidatus Endobugula sp.]|jgi:hypothetical protein